MLTFELVTLVPETERSMVNIPLTLALSIWRGRVNGYLDGSIQNLTDAQLFRAYRDLVEQLRRKTTVGGIQQPAPQRGKGRTKTALEPWPEAQARADEIVAALGQVPGQYAGRTGTERL
jgi:hypothetical protein